MAHYSNLTDAAQEQPSLVTIGVFDGVHQGHQELIQKLVSEAQQAQRRAVALTFYPHPDAVIKNIQERYYLTTPDQRADYLMQLGVDAVITLPFDDALRQVRAADFVDQLVEHLKLATLWVGEDFSLGYKREGHVAFLRQQGVEKGFSVHALDLVINGDGVTVKSATIRKALQAGQLEQANHWLGRAYEVSGEVEHGEKRGRQIGFPTANIAVWDKQIIPANGIYAGWATVDGERYMAMTNVGIRPTFNGDNITVEAYLLDFDQDVYGKQMTVSFDKFLRPEAKFDSIDELIAQIDRDVEVGRAYLASQ
jgi:riboflavin kinase / FMN adenylyltransferase